MNHTAPWTGDPLDGRPPQERLRWPASPLGLVPLPRPAASWVRSVFLPPLLGGNHHDSGRTDNLGGGQGLSSCHQPGGQPAFTSWSPGRDVGRPVYSSDRSRRQVPPARRSPPHPDLPSLAQMKILLQKHVQSEDTYGFPNLLGQKEPRPVTADPPTSGCQGASHTAGV